MSVPVQVDETFKITAIPADNFCTGVEDAHVESSAEIPPFD